MSFAVGDLLIFGPALAPSLLAEAREVLGRRFRREGAPGRLVAQLRPDPRQEKGFEVTFAYVEDGDTLSVRNQVREALGLQADWPYP